MGDGWARVPAAPDRDAYTDLGNVVVDGETFAGRRRDDDGSTHYDWISGPDDGYGFSSSGGSGPIGPERHVAVIGDFLAGIDPATGYLSYP